MALLASFVAVLLPFRQTSPKGVGARATLSLLGFSTSRWGSASELEYQLLLARDLEFLDAETYERLASQTVEVKMMLSSLISRVKAAR